jgi:uncharacterized protein
MPGNHTYPWGNSRRYYSYTDFIKKHFGGRIQKVAVNAGFTCPNRDGSMGTGGCTFCDNNAFSPSYCKPEKGISRQIEEGIEFHSRRYRRAENFLVYFQPYSNTYAPLAELRQKYEEALSFPNVAGLVIGTRPDCVEDETLSYLAELSEKFFIQVEYGVETTNEETLKRINRGHTYGLSKQVIGKTRSLGIHTGAHFIFGLPGESKEEMLQRATVISSLGVETVKFHQLQIIKGTRMEKEFTDDPSAFHIFTRDEYIDFIVTFTERLNPSIAIERFTGEVPPRFLGTNNWGLLRNDQILRLIEKEFERRESWQGRLTNS